MAQKYGAYPSPPEPYPPVSQQPYFTGQNNPPPSAYPSPPEPYPPVSQQPYFTGQNNPPPSGWMNLPAEIPPNCPPGLEYLCSIDQLLVHQKVELLEVFTGFETKNKYTVKNSLGQKIFYAVEDSDCCTRNCCGPIRPFGMKILDNYKRDVMYLNRPLACTSCWFPCCLQKLEVFAPVGCLVGTVEQTWSIFTPQFTIKNSAGDSVLRIEGPFCTCSICGNDVDFNVLSSTNGSIVGKISKQWSGLVREAFTDADYFGITFPMNLDVRMKAVMLGACFLIDYMFFEKSANQETDSPVFTGFETKNKYTVQNSVGEKIFYAVQESGSFSRNCCGPNQPFGMKILDNYKRNIMYLERPLACTSCCFPYCLQTLEVYAPVGCLVGTVEQTWSIFTPKFNIKNSAEDSVLRIEGPSCTCSMCGTDVDFNVLSSTNGSVVGKISKQWSGLGREAFPDAGYFGITFPMSLNVRTKAVMLGACFLIDYMFFEKSANLETYRTRTTMMLLL